MQQLYGALEYRLQQIREFEPGGEPLAYYDPATSSVRTYQASLLPSLDGSSTALFLTWPASGMLSNGVLSPLPTLVRPTNGNASGSWPTPQTRDYKGESGTGRQERKGDPMDTLANATAGWTTPTVDDANNITRSSGSQQSLARDSHQWATPKARDYKDGMSTGAVDRQSPDLGKEVVTFGFQAGQTPSNTEGQTAPSDLSPPAPSHWATPAAQDAVGSHGGGQGKSLRTDTANFRGGKPKGRGLNPRFALWLMGYPISWLDGITVAKKLSRGRPLPVAPSGP